MNDEEQLNPEEPAPVLAERGPLNRAAGWGLPALVPQDASRVDPSAHLRELLVLWRAGLRGVWRRKFLWLALSVFTPGWLLALNSWSTWPLERPLQLALAALGALMLLALPAAALWLVFRGLRSRTVVTAQGYTSLVLWALMGGWLPHRLVWWGIPFESATLEGVAAAIRLVLADAIFSGSMLWLGGVLAHLERRPHLRSEPRP